MTPWGTRRSYPVATGTIIVLAGIFALAFAIRPLIPEPDPSILIRDPGEFVQAGARQRIQWRPSIQKAFEDARRLDKPVMVVAGHRLSEEGRALDDNAFHDPELIEKINLRVVPVRIDISQQPAWEDAVFPITRLTLGVAWGLDVVIFRPNGDVLAWPSRLQLRNASITDWMLDALKKVPDQLRTQTDDWTELQQAERSLVRKPSGVEEQRMENYAQSLVQVISGINGGIPIGGRQEPQLWEWQALITSGHADVVTFSLKRMLEGQAVDWLHGGVFYVNRRSDWTRPLFGKSAIENAEFAAFLARLAVTEKDEGYRRLAEWQAQSVLSEFDTPHGMAGWTYGIQEQDGRCLRYNVPAPVVFGRDFDNEFLRTQLGLDPLGGGPLLVRLKDWRSRFLNSSAYEPVLWQLRATTDNSKVERGQIQDAAVVGTVAARLMEAGVLLGSDEISDQGRALMDRIARSQSGPNDVVKADGRAGELRDYLAVADADYWRWMSLQDRQALGHGESVLRRTLALFVERDGLVRPQYDPLDYRPLPVSARWTDGLGRSEVATLIRLLHLYSATLFMPDLRIVAERMADHYLPAANRARYRVGGLQDAIYRMRQNTTLAVAGTFPESAWRRSVAASPTSDVVIAAKRGLTSGLYWTSQEKMGQPVGPSSLVGPGLSPGS